MVPNAREKPDAEVFTRAGQQLLLHPSGLGPTSSLQPPVSTSTKRKWSKYMYGRRPYCGEKQTTIRRYCKKRETKNVFYLFQHPQKRKWSKYVNCLFCGGKTNHNIQALQEKETKNVFYLFQHPQKESGQSMCTAFSVCEKQTTIYRHCKRRDKECLSTCFNIQKKKMVKVCVLPFLW